MLIVVAIGGNAILKKEEKPSVEHRDRSVLFKNHALKNQQRWKVM